MRSCGIQTQNGASLWGARPAREQIFYIPGNTLFFNLQYSMKNFIALFLLAAFASCNVPAPGTPESTEAKTETTALPANIPETLCFRNEIAFKDNGAMKDVLELQLSIAGEKVTGVYNWLPAEKDQRKGTLTGTIVDKTISADYRFMQEGIKSTVPVQITLTEKEAMVTGGGAELGLEATLAEVGCE